MSDRVVSDLYDRAALAEFYDLGQPHRIDFEFCRALARDASSVLDLGCGTGALAIEIAPTTPVTGVDPAQGMLDIARTRPGGDAVTWIAGDARSVRLGRTFDLIMLTGHTFQVFLTAGDRLAVLATIAAHLNPMGRFVFDTRNPDYPGAKERTKSQTLRQIMHPQHGVVDKWNESGFDPATGILTYTNSYRVRATGELRSATEQISYTGRAALAAVVAEAGLRVDQWFGDWSGAPFAPHASEIIPLGGLP